MILRLKVTEVFFKYVFMYLFVAALGLCSCTGLVLAVVEGGYSLAVVLGLPVAETSLVVKRGL